MSNGREDEQALVGYSKKFANLIKMCAKARETRVGLVVIHHPEVLGDNYAELVESLNRISDAELHLSILPRKDRTPGRVVGEETA